MAWKSGRINDRGTTERTFVRQTFQEDVYQVQSYLKDPEKSTVVRMLPYIDPELDEIIDPVNPEGQTHDELIDDMGPAFCWKEVARIFKDGGCHEFVTEAYHDREGNDIKYDFKYAWSVYNVIMNRVGYKSWVGIQKKNKGYDTDVPAQWLKWKKAQIMEDTRRSCWIQVLPVTVAGKDIKDMEGNFKEITPAVFRIPGSALNNFTTLLFKKRKKNKPLSATNNKFGDFYTQEGCCLELGKTIGQQNSYMLLLDEEMPLTDEQMEYGLPWDQIFRDVVVEDVIDNIYKVFQDEAMIDYGLRDNDRFRGYIPEEMQGAADDIEEPMSADEVRNLSKNKTQVQGADVPPEKEGKNEKKKSTFRSSRTNQPAETVVKKQDEKAESGEQETPGKQEDKPVKQEAPEKDTSEEKEEETESQKALKARLAAMKKKIAEADKINNGDAEESSDQKDEEGNIPF